METATPPRSWLLNQFRAAANRRQFLLALRDLGDGARHWQLWGYMGLHEIRQRYRRSVIGPLWITLSMGIMVSALGVLYGTILKVEIATYLPFLTAGFVIWGLLSSMIIDGTRVFTAVESFIRQMPAPLSLHVYRLVWSNLIIFAHNMLVFVAVAVWFGMKPGWTLVMAVPGMLLVLANGVWLILLLGLLSARFRDIPLITGSVVQVLFFITPVIWQPTMLPGRPLLLVGNPLYQLLEIVRGPLLGYVPPWESWFVVALFTVVGWVITLLFFTAYRWRLAYWV
jgi:ABC-2 type transport system permease protein/lipopolysaccharide transport system permease protein